ncbi:MAG TPA: hypothetical protein VLK58_01040, partial [Conexibacter sp.]|nr:hypothetical protein [Conexibacter sp.]
MRSLRARLVAGLLALAAIGLLALAGITYAEQRSFLLDRVDQQLEEAPMALARALAENGAGVAPGPVGGGAGPGGGRPGGGPPGGGQPGFGLPPGTWGERYDSSGEAIGDPVVIAYDEDAATPQPQLPATITPGEPFTVDARGGGDVQFRVLASRDPAGAGTIVAAIPLTDVAQTLERLLLVEGLVIGGVLLLLGVGAWLLVRVGLLPL